MTFARFDIMATRHHFTMNHSPPSPREHLGKNVDRVHWFGLSSGRKGFRVVRLALLARSCKGGSYVSRVYCVCIYIYICNMITYFYAQHKYIRFILYRCRQMAHILWVWNDLKWTLEFQKCLKRIHQQKRSAWLEMLPWNHQWGMATMLF